MVSAGLLFGSQITSSFSSLVCVVGGMGVGLISLFESKLQADIALDTAFTCLS